MAKAPRRRPPPAHRKAPASKRQKPIGSPERPTTPAKTFTSRPAVVEFASPGHRFASADLEILGIYHGEASYEGRVFFNNPKADQKTPLTSEHGYAGSFHIFGHGGCFGDVGHCDISGHREPYDFRAPHPLTPANKRISVTNALREAARTNNHITVTVVPVVSAANELCNTKDVFRCDQMRFLTYNP